MTLLVLDLLDVAHPALLSRQYSIITEWCKKFIVGKAIFELDTTIMTRSCIRNFQSHRSIRRWDGKRCEDVETGDIIRADHLVKKLLEATLTGDKEIQAARRMRDKKKAGKVRYNWQTRKRQQLMSLLIAKLGDALAENDYVGISAIASDWDFCSSGS
ncbi:hypothetical protein BT96DRAFT_1014661 [Gymnopus androsaceus JB14]|uniref:Uncharacterized protein n=1 Tax=Gymnopus androsaceus JB14 TaxID=1447944 RepID=A0A6A4I488_9AGAR|nr:hypothetical protein BT96DRAFT_1014661 [Gymnopus androsaceus JB14]